MGGAEATLSKGEVRGVVDALLSARGLRAAFTLNKLGLDALIINGALTVEEPVITFSETPNARQGDARHPADAARLIRAWFGKKPGSHDEIAEAWYAKSVKPSLLPSIAHIAFSDADTERLVEVNSEEFRARLIADAAVQGVRLGFGRFGEDGYELSDEPWVVLETPSGAVERVYRSEIRRHLTGD